MATIVALWDKDQDDASNDAKSGTSKDCKGRERCFTPMQPDDDKCNGHNDGANEENNGRKDQGESRSKAWKILCYFIACALAKRAAAMGTGKNMISPLSICSTIELLL